MKIEDDKTKTGGEGGGEGTGGGATGTGTGTGGSGGAPEKKPGEGTAKTEGAAGGEKPKVTKTSKDDEPADSVEPTQDEKGLVTMPYRKFIQRLGRMTKREMKKHFGTDNVEDIVAEREELKTLRTEKEERARKDMTDKQKAEDDLKKERELRKAAEEKAEAAEVRIIVRETQHDVAKLATQYVDPEFEDDALDKLTKYMRLHPGEIKKLKHVDAWFKELVEARPKWAKEKPAGDDATKKTEVKKQVPLTTGGGKRPETKGVTPGDKPVKSMSHKEIKEKYGVTMP